MKAVEAGRLDQSIFRTDRGWIRIDPELGNREWDEWTDQAKAQGGHAAPKGAKTPELFPTDEDRELAAGKVTHAKASTERILVDAELKKLDLEARRGELVNRAEVARESFRIARHVRNAMNALPKRLGSILASIDDPKAVHDALEGEIDAALSELVDELALEDVET